MRLHRAAETDRPAVTWTLDGGPATALAGDTVLTAILTGEGWVRRGEFGDDDLRAGFCWIGACQDCGVWIEGTGRARACTTYVRDGMQVRRL